MVVSLTEGMWSLPNFMLKERSRMQRKLRDLWGIIATGDIFRCFGGLDEMSFHFTNFAKPPLTFSMVSLIRHRRACGFFAET